VPAGARISAGKSGSVAMSLPTSAGILWWMGFCDPVRVVIAAVMCALAVWRHKSNIQRLIAGTEKRFEKIVQNQLKLF
jgi:glycerol-3-phosphate acyltransferase PlsY